VSTSSRFKSIAQLLLGSSDEAQAAESIDGIRADPVAVRSSPDFFANPTIWAGVN
jgi:hypothetical protein